MIPGKKNGGLEAELGQYFDADEAKAIADEVKDEAFQSEEEQKKIETDAIKKAWSILDPDDNGDLDVTEWLQRLKGLQIDIDDETANKAFKQMDVAKSGYIDQAEFVKFCSTKITDNDKLEGLRTKIMNKMLWRKRLIIGALIDVYDTADRQWRWAEVVDIDNNENENTSFHFGLLSLIIDVCFFSSFTLPSTNT